MLYGHVHVALANGLRGDHPFSEACLVAMDYGRATLIKDDWKRIFDDSELDANIAKMRRLKPAHVRPRAECPQVTPSPDDEPHEPAGFDGR